MGVPATKSKAEAFELGQHAVLERIAAGAVLPELLGQIVSLIERQADGMLCSILLVDAEAGRVRHGAASRLPPEFCRAIDGTKIGPNEGSCGAAAYRRERVIVENIATHPNWAAYRDFTLPLGLRACWSSPIFSPTGQVLGTFAIYYRETHTPTAAEIAWVDRATHLASISIMRDQMAEAVRASERLRTLVYNGVTDVLFYVGVEEEHGYRFLSVNPAFLKATGVPEEMIIGKRVDQIIPEPSLTTVLSNYETAIRERRTVCWEEATKYPAGMKYGEVSITPVFDPSGHCTHLVGTVHDITERKLAEDRNIAQAALLDRARDAIVVRDIDGTVRYWNKGAERLYGWTSAEAVGRGVVDLIYRDTSAFEQAMARLVANGSWASEILQINKAGKQVVVECSWTLLRDENGAPKSVLAINSDITERKSLEMQVQRTQRLESLGALAGGIAHDFNNILTAIAANVKFAIEDLAPDHPSHESLAVIEQASTRAIDLVRRILTFSNQQAPKRQIVKPQAVVNEALKLLRATAAPGVRIEPQFASDIPDFFADPTQLHQVVMNLGTNAVHAIDRNEGSVRVRLDRVTLDSKLFAGTTELREGTYARLEIADTGCGMDASTIERIFDPMFTTKEEGKGTGLGLSVVHGIMRSHEGGILVSSEVGRGSVFTLYFPAAV